MYIKRDMEKDVKRYLPKREIIAIVGPRQSGKTTLLKHVFQSLKGARFLDFEDRETLELFNDDIKSFVDLHVRGNNYLFIDEFQYAREGGRQLKYIYDHHKTKIIITGSSASGLSIHGIKYLVGRIFVLNLYPFSFVEYLSYKDPRLHEIYLKNRFTKPVTGHIIRHFNEFCIFGGYPRVVLADDKKEKEDVLRNIYNTYFLKEIKEILNLPEDHKLSRLIKSLALQIGSVINYNDLSEITGFAYNDLLKHMNVLEKTYISIRSQPFYTNKRTELVKAPKIFFLDNGFRNVVLKDFQPIGTRADKGHLYENFVASEIIKAGSDVKYWRTKSKAEVDFIVEKAGKVIPIEVKSGLRTPKITKSFHSFLEKYSPKNSLVLSESLSAEKGKTLFRPMFSVAKEL